MRSSMTLGLGHGMMGQREKGFKINKQDATVYYIKN